jgi:hypothetical protein
LFLFQRCVLFLFLFGFFLGLFFLLLSLFFDELLVVLFGGLRSLLGFLDGIFAVFDCLLRILQVLFEAVGPFGRLRLGGFFLSECFLRLG